MKLYCIIVLQQCSSRSGTILDQVIPQKTRVRVHTGVDGGGLRTFWIGEMLQSNEWDMYHPCEPLASEWGMHIPRGHLNRNENA